MALSVSAIPRNPPEEMITAMISPDFASMMMSSISPMVSLAEFFTFTPMICEARHEVEVASPLDAEVTSSAGCFISANAVSAVSGVNIGMSERKKPLWIGFIVLWDFRLIDVFQACRGVDALRGCDAVTVSQPDHDSNRSIRMFHGDKPFHHRIGWVALVEEA